MTHSHDTSTPAMSDETVPSEEFVLVPREPTHEMKEAGARENQGMYPIAIYRAMIGAAPAPNPSPAAKGGDASLFFYLRDGGPCRFYRTWAEVMEDAEEQIAYFREIAQEEGEWPSTADEIAIYACEFETDEPEDDGVLMAQSRPVPSGVDDDGREHFEYAMKLALTTPTEGPASQTEGMGGLDTYDAGLLSDYGGGNVDWWWDYIRSELANAHKFYADQFAALTPPETAEAVPVACHADDLAVDRFAVAMKSKLADARAKGKGGWNDETECSRQYLSDELRRHALKPDPLDVANFAMFLHQRGETIAPDPEAARLREDLERESKESYDIGKRDGYEEAVQHIDQRTGGDGEYCCVVGYDADDRHCPDPQTMIFRIVGRFESLAGQTNSANQERDEAVKALETARAATASDPAPATDERERLVEALRRSAQGWANVIELGLLPAQHVATAQELHDDARAALATEASR